MIKIEISFSVCEKHFPLTVQLGQKEAKKKPIQPQQ